MTAPPVAEPSTAASEGRRPRRLLLAALAVALLVGTAVRGGWVLTHADLLQPFGNRIEVQLTVGEVRTIGLWAQPLTGEVDVVTAVPRVVSNTADADLRLLLCHRRAGPIGTASGPADEVCDEVAAPAGAALRPAAADFSGLVLEVTPRRAGDVHVAGVQIEYRSGLRRGSGVSGTSAIARVREASAG